MVTFAHRLFAFSSVVKLPSLKTHRSRCLPRASKQEHGGGRVFYAVFISSNIVAISSSRFECVSNPPICTTAT